MSVEVHKRRCAYCGGGEATTVDHVIPRALYPESKQTSKIQRITVPACQACNGGWADDEPHFRNILLISGESTPVVDELWHGKTSRSFEQVDGLRRRRDVRHRLVPVQMAGGERHKVYPADDPRFMRVLRKVIRGLSHHHKVLTPVSDEQMWADVQRFAVPPEFLAEMTVAHADPDIIEYRWAVLPGDEFVHSCWLLKFFGRTPFIGVVFHSAEALLASERAAHSESAS
jgi:hypothetical protein